MLDLDILASPNDGRFIFERGFLIDGKRDPPMLAELAKRRPHAEIPS
jgi:hypothetical protein